MPVLANVVAPAMVLLVPTSEIFCVVAETLNAFTVTLLARLIVLPLAPSRVSVWLPPPLMTPENVVVPPFTAVNVALLFNVTAPENVELFAVLPPIVAVPLLPA